GACGAGAAQAQGFNPWPQPPGGNAIQRDGSMGATLTADGLNDLLGRLGLNPERKAASDGSPYFVVKVRRDNLNLSVLASLSQDHSRVWLEIYLVDLPESDRLPAGRLLRLLQENRQMASMFSCSENGKELWLKRSFTNRDITPE